MREMFRVLSPGGVAVVQVPIYGQTTYEDFSIASEADRLAAFDSAIMCANTVLIWRGVSLALVFTFARFVLRRISSCAGVWG